MCQEMNTNIEVEIRETSKASVFPTLQLLHLKDRGEPVEHVLELLLLLVGQRRDHGLHLASLEVRHLERVLHQQLGVDQAGPGEQMDQPGDNKRPSVTIYREV